MAKLKLWLINDLRGEASDVINKPHHVRNQFK